MRPKNLLQEQEGRCFYCGTQMDPEVASVDHVVPRCHGGGGSPRNLVACCRKMNHMFDSLSPKEKIEVLLTFREGLVCPMKDEAGVRKAIQAVRPKKTRKKRKRKPKKLYPIPEATTAAPA